MIDQWSRFLFACGWSIAAAVLASPAHSELKDEQVGHLIFMKTNCRLQKLARTENHDGSWSYNGTCQNVVHYPDGIHVTCPDPESDDERICIIHTEPKSFDHLKLLNK